MSAEFPAPAEIIAALKDNPDAPNWVTNEAFSYALRAWAEAESLVIRARAARDKIIAASPAAAEAGNAAKDLLMFEKHARVMRRDMGLTPRRGRKYGKPWGSQTSSASCATAR